MQAAMDEAFPQALGMFEKLEEEEKLLEAGIVPGNQELQARWIEALISVLSRAGLSVPVERSDGKMLVRSLADSGGRTGSHLEHLTKLVDEMQLVYRSVPHAHW
jgi:ring-1,2-phenylacetyl-CoA epoxidase subunit PaaC